MKSWWFSLLLIISFFGTTSFIAYKLTRKRDTQIVMWDLCGKAGQAMMDNFVSAFREQHRDVTLNLVHFHAPEEIQKAFAEHLENRATPHILVMNNTVALHPSIQSQLLNVTPWVDRDRFIPSVFDSAVDEYGELRGIPLLAESELLLYINNRLTGGREPRMLDDLLQLAQQLQNPSLGQYGLAFRYTEAYLMIPWIMGYGGRLISGTSPELNSPEVIHGLEAFQKLVLEKRLTPVEDLDRLDTLFDNGKIAMLIEGEWARKSHELKLGSQLTIRPLPFVGSTGLPMQSMVQGSYLFVTSELSGKALATAKALAEMMTSDKIQTLIAQKYRLIPAVKTVVIERDPTLTAARDATNRSIPYPFRTDYDAIWSSLGTVLPRTISGELNATQAAQVMQQIALAHLQPVKQGSIE